MNTLELGQWQISKTTNECRVRFSVNQRFRLLLLIFPKETVWSRKGLQKSWVAQRHLYFCRVNLHMCDKYTESLQSTAGNLIKQQIKADMLVLKKAP